MSADRFAASLALVLSYESGFVDDPRDPGGATCWGVTLRTLSEFRGKTCTVADVQALSRAAVQPIYQQNYWTPVQGDELPAGLDLLVFDGAVNQGVNAVSRMLQHAVGVEADGAIGSITLAAISKLGAAETIERLKARRLDTYQANILFPVYGTGWTRRLNAMASTAAGWATKAVA